jgi:hypothetical protein
MSFHRDTSGQNVILLSAWDKRLQSSISLTKLQT